MNVWISKSMMPRYSRDAAQTQQRHRFYTKGKFTQKVSIGYDMKQQVAHFEISGYYSSELWIMSST